MVEIQGKQIKLVDQVKVVRDINQLTGTFSFRKTFNNNDEDIQERVTIHTHARVNIYMGGYQLIAGEVEKFSAVESSSSKTIIVTGRGLMNRIIGTSMAIDYPRTTRVQSLFKTRVIEKGAKVFNRFKTELSKYFDRLVEEFAPATKKEAAKIDEERFINLFIDVTPVNQAKVENTETAKKRFRRPTLRTVADEETTGILTSKKTTDKYVARPTESLLDFYLKWFGKLGLHLFEIQNGDLVIYSSSVKTFPPGIFGAVDKQKAQAEKYEVNPLSEGGIFKLTRGNKINSTTVSDTSNLFEYYFFMSDASLASDNEDLKVVVRRGKGIFNRKSAIVDAKTTVNDYAALHRQADMYMNEIYKKVYQFEFQVQGEIIYPMMKIDASDIDRQITLTDDLVVARCEYDVDMGVTIVSCAKKSVFSAIRKNQKDDLKNASKEVKDKAEELFKKSGNVGDPSMYLDQAIFEINSKLRETLAITYGKYRT